MTRTLFLVFMMLLLGPVQAAAQTPVLLRETDFQKEWGLNLKGSAGYDSNVSYGSGDNNLSERVDAALRFYLGGEYHKATPGLFDEKKLGLKYGYNVASGITLFSAFAPSSYFSPRLQLSLNGEMLQQQSKAFSFSVYGNMDRHSDPHRLFPDKTYSWDTVRAGFRFESRPGAGLTSIDGRLDANGVIFEDSVLRYNDRMRLYGSLKVAYDIFFKTQLWVMGNAFTYYYLYGYDPALALGNINSSYAGAMGGVTTPITVNLAFTAGGGYMWGWYDLRSSPSGWIVDTSLTYSSPGRLSSRIGVRKGYYDSFLGSYKEVWTAYGRLYMSLPNQRFSVEGVAKVDFATHHDIAANMQSPDHSQTITVLGCTGTVCTRADLGGNVWLKLNYQLSQKISVYLTYNFQFLTTSFKTQSTNAYTNVVSIQNPSFIKHVVLANVAYVLY